MGCFHAEQPSLGKERVRPALMGVTQTTMTTHLVTLQKNSSQAAAKADFANCLTMRSLRNGVQGMCNR